MPEPGSQGNTGDPEQVNVVSEDWLQHKLLRKPWSGESDPLSRQAGTSRIPESLLSEKPLTLQEPDLVDPEQASTGSPRWDRRVTELHVSGAVTSREWVMCVLWDTTSHVNDLGQEKFSVVAIVVPEFSVWNLKLSFTGGFQIRI